MCFSFFANSCSFRLIIAMIMNIIPQTKDHSLKTAIVFGLSPPKSLPPEAETFRRNHAVKI